MWLCRAHTYLSWHFQGIQYLLLSQPKFTSRVYAGLFLKSIIPRVNDSTCHSRHLRGSQEAVVRGECGWSLDVQAGLSTFMCSRRLTCKTEPEGEREGSRKHVRGRGELPPPLHSHKKLHMPLMVLSGNRFLLIKFIVHWSCQEVSCQKYIWASWDPYWISINETLLSEI